MSSDHHLEIRYEPMGSFLNIRGAVADFVKSQGLFQHWLISANRVDFWSVEDRDDDPETAFVSFRNCGYKVHRPATNNFFSERATKFLLRLLASA